MTSPPPLHPLRGQEELREALSRSILRGTLPPVLLLRGSEGIGKQRFGLWIAQHLLCERMPPNESALSPEAPGESNVFGGGRGGCGECRGCRLLLRLEHPDFHWAPPLPRPRGASAPEKLAQALEEERGRWIERARAHPLRSSGGELEEGEGAARSHYLQAMRTLRLEALKAPTLASRRIFLLPEVHLLQEESGSALLKLLEEPPPHAQFILTTSEPGNVLATIRSRSIGVSLSPLPPPAIRTFLVSEMGIEESEAERAAILGEGSLGRAIGFLPEWAREHRPRPDSKEEQEGERGPLDALRVRGFQLLRVALDGGLADRLGTGLESGSQGARALVPLLGALELWLRDLAAAATGPDSGIINREAEAWLRGAAARHRLDPARVARAQRILEEGRRMAKGNVNPQLLLPTLLHRLRRALLG